MIKLTVFGGDMRMRFAAQALSADGFEVDSLGLYADDSATPDSSRIFLLPAPASRDGINIWAPLTDKKIPLSFIEKNAKERLVLYGVKAPEAAHRIDYCADNAYAVLNAVPTAEGALSVAMENTDFTLSGSKALLIGFGRCGRVLADRLLGLHCRLTVAARRPQALAEAESIGARAIPFSELFKSDEKYDIIFNTADTPLPCASSPGSTVIDISTAGCMTDSEVLDRRIRLIRAPGLPGKSAPKTAGLILARTVKRLVTEYYSGVEL